LTFRFTLHGMVALGREHGTEQIGCACSARDQSETASATAGFSAGE
jgi:hypothetical protein